MTTITLSTETINKVKNFIENMEVENEVKYFEFEVEQDETTIFVSGQKYTIVETFVNETYCCYEDVCSEIIDEGYDIEEVVAYDEDNNEIEIVNARELEAA